MTLRVASAEEHLLRAVEEKDKPDPAYDTPCGISQNLYTIDVLDAITAIPCLSRSDKTSNCNRQLRPKSRASKACRKKRLPQDITVK